MSSKVRYMPSIKVSMLRKAGTSNVSCTITIKVEWTKNIFETVTAARDLHFSQVTVRKVIQHRVTYIAALRPAQCGASAVDFFALISEVLRRL